MNDDACTPVTVTGADGAQLTACLHGGHVLGWVPAGGGQRLWLSPAARCGPGKAIRGGVPVIFPQFSDRGPLPKHGIARDRAWQRLPPDALDDRLDGSAAWSVVLRDDEVTRAVWPQSFELTLTAVARGRRLDIDLSVRNTGTESWSFTAALHGYLAVLDPTAVLAGLGGRGAQDNAAGGARIRLGEPGEALAALDRRDVAVPGVTDPIELIDPEAGLTTLTAEGFTDRVVWNPGPGHGLGDVPEGAESGFVCLEAARLDPVELRTGERWTGRQTLAHEPSPTVP